MNEVHQATFHFYGHLNSFIAPARRQVPFAFQFDSHRSIKDIIESFGVPHPEVALILVNGVQVEWTYHIQDGDQVAIHPIGETTPQPDHAPLPGDIRFVADVHLGRLTAYLRMLGFDTLYPDDYRDEELARISSTEERVLLTRDVGLLKRSIVTQGYYVLSTDPWQQLAEVLRRFHLFNAITDLRRCTQCNGLLEPVAKETIAERLMPNTRRYFTDFRICQSCSKIYWKGSHYDHMAQFLSTLTSGN